MMVRGLVLLCPGDLLRLLYVVRCENDMDEGGESLFGPSKKNDEIS